MTKKIVSYLFDRFLDKNSGLFNLTTDDPTKTSYVNGHIAWVLARIGEKERAISIFDAMLASNLFDTKSELFRYSAGPQGVINADKNFGANVCMLRAAYMLGKEEWAKAHFLRIKKTFYDEQEGLYRRSTVDKSLFNAQPHFWLIDTLYENGNKDEAKKLYDKVVDKFFDEKKSLIVSWSSKFRNKYKDRYLFPDDNALFVMVSARLNKNLSIRVRDSLFASELFSKEKHLFRRKINLNKRKSDGDTMSIYKNGLCLALLAGSGHHEIEAFKQAFFSGLFNIKKRTFSEDYADSLFFGLLALHTCTITRGE